MHNYIQILNSSIFYIVYIVNEDIMHISFLRFKPGNRFRIPVKYINEDQSQDIRRGKLIC